MYMLRHHVWLRAIACESKCTIVSTLSWFMNMQMMHYGWRYSYLDQRRYTFNWTCMGQCFADSCWPLYWSLEKDSFARTDFCMIYSLEVIVTMQIPIVRGSVWSVLLFIAAISDPRIYVRMLCSAISLSVKWLHKTHFASAPCISSRIKEIVITTSNKWDSLLTVDVASYS